MVTVPMPKVPEEVGRYLTEKLTGCCHEPQVRLGEPYVSRENLSMVGCDYAIVCARCHKELDGMRELESREDAARSAERSRLLAERDAVIDFGEWPAFGRLWNHMYALEDFAAWRAFLHRRGLEATDASCEFWPSGSLIEPHVLAEQAYAFFRAVECGEIVLPADE